MDMRFMDVPLLRVMSTGTRDHGGILIMILMTLNMFQVTYLRLEFGSFFIKELY